MSAKPSEAPTLPPNDPAKAAPEAVTRPGAPVPAADSGKRGPETVAEAAGQPVRDAGRARSAAPSVHVPGYEILGELGRGGMGVVYKARQIKLNRVVALKMILSSAHAGPDELERFRIEAEAVARLQHPHIVQIYEVGEHDGRPFFSLEFCPGGALDKKLNGTPLRPTEAAALVETLARAMHAAHQRQVIHRDLKPANVLLAADGQPKITDFGLAKKLDDAGQTQSGAIMGTPSYMAPEQASGRTKEIGPAADVYALGVILYECLTGRPPFKAATVLDTIQQVVADEPVPPRQLQPKTPRDLETICLKCLEKQAGRRYATAEALADDLRRFSAGEPVRARPVGAAERAAKWARRRPALAAVYGLLLTALVLGGVGGGATWLWLRAEGAKGDAEAARNQAVSAQSEAESAKGEAVSAQRRAETAKGEAEAARTRAETAEGQTKQAKRQLTEFSYADAVYSAQREWDNGETTRAKELLKEAGALEEQLTPGGRPWEWEYLNRVFHPEVAVLQGNMVFVFSVAFSPDGGRLATASFDTTARLWDAVSGKPLAGLQGHMGPVMSVAFSPDGCRVATGSFDSTARLWDAASGKPLAVLKGHMGGVACVAFSPDGRRLATASGDGTARLWDVASGRPVVVFQGHSGSVLSVTFSPDGSRIATASNDGTVRLWIAREGQEDQEKRQREQNRSWREQQAVDAEKGNQWFAAAFDLSRLIDSDPANVSLYARRCRAYAMQGQWSKAAADLRQPGALGQLLEGEGVLAGPTIGLTFINGGDAPVSISLSGWRGVKMTLEPKESQTFRALADVKPQPVVIIDQPDSGPPLSFTVEDGGDYVILRDQDGKIRNHYKSPPVAHP